MKGVGAQGSARGGWTPREPRARRADAGARPSAGGGPGPSGGVLPWEGGREGLPAAVAAADARDPERLALTPPPPSASPSTPSSCGT